MKVLQQETPPHSEFNSWILCHGLDAEVEAGTSVFLGHSTGSPAVTEWTMSAVPVDKPPRHTSALGCALLFTSGPGWAYSAFSWVPGAVAGEGGPGRGINGFPHCPAFLCLCLSLLAQPSCDTRRLVFLSPAKSQCIRWACPPALRLLCHKILIMCMQPRLFLIKAIVVK